MIVSSETFITLQIIAVSNLNSINFLPPIVSKELFLSVCLAHNSAVTQMENLVNTLRALSF